MRVCDDCLKPILNDEEEWTIADLCFDCCEEYHLAKSQICTDHGHCPYTKCNAGKITTNE